MSRLKLYNISDEYINYLRKFDNKVLSSKEEDRKKDRKYLGIVLHINDFNFFVPLASPKDADYTVVNGVKTIRKSIIPIMRIVVKDISGNDELKGTLKFSNMIPVPNVALINYDVSNEEDEDYKILVLKEISFINPNTVKIIRNARVIYNQKINKFDIGYIKRTVDFSLLEEKCQEWESIQQSLSAPQEQIAADKLNS